MGGYAMTVLPTDNKQAHQNDPEEALCSIPSCPEQSYVTDPGAPSDPCETQVCPSLSRMARGVRLMVLNRTTFVCKILVSEAALINTQKIADCKYTNKRSFTSYDKCWQCNCETYTTSGRISERNTSALAVVNICNATG